MAKISNKRLISSVVLVQMLSGCALMSCSTTGEKKPVAVKKQLEKVVPQTEAERVSSEVDFPNNLEFPTWETLAVELDIPEEDVVEVAENFAKVIQRGVRSSSFEKVCAEGEAHCDVLNSYFDDTNKLYRARVKQRRQNRRNRRGFRVRKKNANWVQTQNISRVMRGMRVRSKSEFLKIAKYAQKTTACPRNLSLALVLRVDKYFNDPSFWDLSKQLFDHAQQCLDKENKAWETAHLRQGLYSLAHGEIDRAEEMLIESMEATKTRESYRALYWLGQIQHDRGIKKDANGSWQLLIEKYPTSYYSISAKKAWGIDPMAEIPETATFELSRKSKKREDLNIRVRWLEALILLDKPSAVKRWVEWVSRDLKGLEVEMSNYLSKVFLENRFYRQNIMVMRRYYKHHPEHISRQSLRAMYPRPYLEQILSAAKNKIDPQLVMSLIRQESAFDKNAVSPARARGLMQIIPRTARRLQRGGHRKLFIAEENTKMGVKYLYQLAKRYDGQMALVLAAYNAGPRRVDQWLRRKPSRSDALLWSDLIPFMETRDYVTSVLRNNYWYARLYGSDSEAEGYSSGMVGKLTP